MTNAIREKVRALLRSVLTLAKAEEDVGTIAEATLSFAIGALVGLGYTKAGIRDIVEDVLESPDLTAAARENAQNGPSA